MKVQKQILITPETLDEESLIVNSGLIIVWFPKGGWGKGYDTYSFDINMEEKLKELKILT